MQHRIRECACRMPYALERVGRERNQASHVASLARVTLLEAHISGASLYRSPLFSRIACQCSTTRCEHEGAHTALRKPTASEEAKTTSATRHRMTASRAHLTCQDTHDDLA